MSEAQWSAGLRRGLVRDLLRPLQLARDVEGGWIGDLLGRAAWPELRLPLLADWTARWSSDADDLPELPIVHARPLPDAPAAAPALVQVQAVVAPAAAITKTPAAEPAPPVRMRPLADGPRDRPQRSAPAPARDDGAQPLAPTHRDVRTPATIAPAHTSPTALVSTIAAPPSQRDAPIDLPPPPPPPHDPPAPVPARPRRSHVDLPRVVAAFRPDLAERIAAGSAHAGDPPPRPAAPAGSEAPAEAAPRRTPRAAVTVEPIADDPGPLPFVHTEHSPSDITQETLWTPSGAVAHAHPVAREARPVAQADPQLVHAPAAAHPAEASPTPAAPAERSSSARPSRPASKPQDMSSPPDPARPRPRAAARPTETPPVRARPRRPGADRPARVQAATWSGVDPLPDLARPAPPLAAPAPAFAPRTDLPHAPAPAPAPAAARPAGPAASPVSEDIHSQPPPVAAPPAAPALDIDALVDTVKRRLARDLERSRELRRAIR